MTLFWYFLTKFITNFVDLKQAQSLKYRAFKMLCCGVLFYLNLVVVKEREEEGGKMHLQIGIYEPLSTSHGFQLAIARFLDRICLALRASRLWLRYATLQNLIPSFPWIAPGRRAWGRNPRKGRDQILPSGKWQPCRQCVCCCCVCASSPLHSAALCCAVTLSS